jgi:hypothetical protein
MKYGAEAARAITQLHWDDAHLMAAGAPFELGEQLLEWSEKAVFGSGGCATAEDDKFWIEHVDQ